MKIINTLKHYDRLLVTVERMEFITTDQEFEMWQKIVKRYGYGK